MTFNSTVRSYNIPRLNPIGTTVPITISGQPTIATFNSVTISGLTHSLYADLRAFLSNGTTTVQLFATRTNPDNATFAIPSLSINGNYTFANTGENWYTQTSAPVPVSTYSSLQPLSAFNGVSLDGTWTLNIQNRGPSLLGFFTGWSFDVTPQQSPTAVPEPTTVLGLVALGGMAVATRLKRK